MDYSPLPNSSLSRLPSLDVPPVPLRSGPTIPERVPDPSGLVDVLRQALDGNTRSSESILRAATDVARVLTGAHGTAVALRTNGVVVCRARSGDIAPGVGSPLNIESGISGESIRSASILVCDDAETDQRVDREACLGMGVRSIVVVPLRGPAGIAGILEAFSTCAHAFGTEQIESLRALAEIAEIAYAREGRATGPVPAPVAPAATQPALFAKAGLEEQTRVAKFSDEYSPRRSYWLPAVVVIAVLMVSLVVWWSWSEPAAETAASEVPAGTSGTPVETSDRPALRVLPKPTPGITGQQTDRSRTKKLLQNAAEIDPDVAGTQGSSSDISATDLGAKPATTLPRSATTSPVVEPAPSVEVVPSTTSTELASLSAPSSPLPSLATRVSTGATEAVLIRRVDPVYPPRARIQRLAGAVNLEATIAEDGSIHDVKVVNGPAALAAAATEAVMKWRYNPSTLNGKPIAVQKRITIIFKLP